MVADLGKLAVERLDARLEAHAADTFQWSGRADNIGRTSGRGQDDGAAGISGGWGRRNFRLAIADCGFPPPPTPNPHPQTPNGPRGPPGSARGSPPPPAPPRPAPKTPTPLPPP